MFQARLKKANSELAPIELFRSLLQQATAQASRANALNPLAWAFGLALSALLVAARISGAPQWLLVLLGVAVAGTGSAFLVAYFILLFIDRDALRSERFTLSKLAIEKSVTGDSLRGFTALDIGAQNILPTPAETTEQRERQQ
jgi:threonine/homoserine/homoserine lactone efflux protein